MLAAASLIEKEFEVWPGLLRLAAAGEGARDALDAGMDMAREILLTLMADAELFARGSADILPRGVAGRLALEAFHTLRDALPVDDLPPALAALPGAVCDAVLATMGEGGRTTLALVSVGDVLAVRQDAGESLPVRTDLSPVLHEFCGALGAGPQWGAALGGSRSATPTSGLADLVAVQAPGAALAGLVAAMLSDAVDVAGAPRLDGHLRDRLLALGWTERRVVGAAGLVEPEAVWQALSAAVRRASALREKRLLRAAALGLKGRGRIVGPVDGDRLLRFGVSEWR